MPCWILLRGYCCFINNTLRQALAIEGAVIWLSAVTSAWDGCGWGIKYLRVMAAYNCGHVTHAAVADLHVASVKQFVVSVMLGKVFIYKIQESLRYVGFDILVEWGVEPDDLPFARSRWLNLSSLEFHLVLVATLL